MAKRLFQTKYLVIITSMAWYDVILHVKLFFSLFLLTSRGTLDRC